MKISHLATASLLVLASACASTESADEASGQSVDSTMAMSPMPASSDNAAKSLPTLTMFDPGYVGCYDRETMPYTAVVDTHNHFRPFGGAPVPFEELMGYFRDNGVLFVNAYGIGQSLPVDSSCEYYLDCVGTPALPSMKNDFANADLLDYDPEGVVVTLSMTFPDLANPEDVPEQIAILDKEYPGMFGWMGEVNLVKQALMGNDHEPATKEDIDNWAPFMETLRERNIPIAIHSDLGNDVEPEKYLDLMEYVLERYPDNKIVWMHLGLSKELTTLSASRHIEILVGMMADNPNLWLDISWRVVYDNYFVEADTRATYVDFFNSYGARILPGTDFVAAHVKNGEIYAEELDVTSDILKDVDDEAFRNIALGGSYFAILDMDYEAPAICEAD